MSATNRGAKRNEADFYATPLETVYAILDVLPDLDKAEFILEPSAGNGNIIKALRKLENTNINYILIKN
jgi:hypothetical protein